MYDIVVITNARTNQGSTSEFIFTIGLHEITTLIQCLCALMMDEFT